MVANITRAVINLSDWDSNKFGKIKKQIKVERTKMKCLNKAPQNDDIILMNEITNITLE